MKIIHKLIIGNTLAIIAITMVAVFSYYEFNLIHDKLQFVEIADTFNASLLKMRLSEKNYFLYHDETALLQIKKELGQKEAIIQSLKANIIRSVGRKEFNTLQLFFTNYKNAIAQIDTAGDTKSMKVKVREAGHTLKHFSENMTRLERKKVNKIIDASRKTLLYFFCIVIFMVIATAYLFFSKMFRSLRSIEKTARTISRGRFEKIDEKISNDEFGSVILALNSMSEELRSREDQLVQSKKLASIGILTAGVAHELGNPLNNISMIAQTYLSLYRNLPEEDRLDYIKTVLNETERIKNIVQDLLNFSKPKGEDFAIDSINRVIRNSHRLVRNTLHISGIKSKFDLQEHLPPVVIDRNKIQEVIVNLETNAIQAMSPGGLLSVKTRYKEGDRYISIKITDTGKGIEPEFIDNIFDPFFSTKGTEGTGLGLSIVYGLIEKHKGRINVKSKIGVGTTFSIELPVYTLKEDKDGQRLQNHGDR